MSVHLLCVGNQVPRPDEVNASSGSGWQCFRQISINMYKPKSTHTMQTYSVQICRAGFDSLPFHVSPGASGFKRVINAANREEESQIWMKLVETLEIDPKPFGGSSFSQLCIHFLCTLLRCSQQFENPQRHAE